MTGVTLSCLVNIECVCRVAEQCNILRICHARCQGAKLSSTWITGLVTGCSSCIVSGWHSRE